MQARAPEPSTICYLHLPIYRQIPWPYTPKFRLTAAAQLFSDLQLGNLTSLKGCEGGIENTNYFASSDMGDYVLTLFERLSAEQLPFYLHLMKHLAQRGIPVPDPQANKDGDILLSVLGKPAAVVNRLKGKSQLQPTAAHCAAVGDMLARMHVAGRDYGRAQPNLRGLPWWNETVPVVLPYLNPSQAALIQSELAYQNHVQASAAYAALPRGPVHADLFRDNVMFDGDTLTGFFDFYFAGVDTWLFDIGREPERLVHRPGNGPADAARETAFVQAYDAARPLSKAERQLLPAMLRAGALRFWLSRLWDLHLPRDAAVLTAHDPAHFERVLRCANHPT